MCQHGVLACRALAISVSGTLGQDVSASCPGVEGPSCMAVTNDVSAWCPVGPSCFS